MTDPYQLWGIRPAKVSLVKLGGYKTLGRLKTAWRKHLEQGMARDLQARLYITNTNYTIINDKMLTVELREFNSSLQRDQAIIKEATHFTIVAFLGTGRYDRHQSTTLEEARELGKVLAKERKKNYIIYAINSRGNSAYVEYIKGV